MITRELLLEKLREAEAARDEAARAAQHWEGRAAQLRELLAVFSEARPEGKKEDV
jgi:hypothetical protein